ncbi:hypothetical protein FQR65_LT18551 [Abscondita terminalis]|nr:hypothetical protein FQR65_LT18551 [Abscondita terminalis]
MEPENKCKYPEKDMDALYEKHILHSLGIAKVMPFVEKHKVLDIWYRWWFPGIPLAILFPDTHFTLVDSIGKKIAVVNAIAESLPNVGKSTLFNCLSNAKAQSANYPFCTIEPNVGTVSVPDQRLFELEKLVKPERVLPAVVEIVDIAGLVKGASKGEGLGNQFLANIRECEAIIHVLRCFENDNITHVEGTVDPLRDKDIIDIELQLKDWSSAPDLKLILNELETFEERQIFLEELGLEEPGVNRLIRAAYTLLNLQTYFTAGVKEVRAWTIGKGWTAPQAAGVIHTDFEKGILSCRVIKYNDYIQYGSEAKIKEADITISRMSENTTVNYSEDKYDPSSGRAVRLRPGMYIGKLGDGSSADDGIYILLKRNYR